ncbi:uncharacterized protein [Rhodnius prolixus]|uniref:uncharacterized protein n=1 Tax=Rhodnius prolixus TaxID=13249 RepID=UPI003D18FA35
MVGKRQRARRALSSSPNALGETHDAISAAVATPPWSQHAVPAAQVYNPRALTPPFTAEHVETWLEQFENAMNLGAVQDDQKKYAYLTALLPTDVMAQAAGAIRTTTGGKYLAMRSYLITRYGVTSERRLDRLFAEGELGDRRPTQLLDDLQRLASGTEVGATVIRRLWLQRLPTNLRTIVVAHSAPLEELAAIADRVLTAQQPSYAAPTNMPPVMAPVDSVPETSNLEEQGATALYGLAQAEVADARTYIRQRKNSANASRITKLEVQIKQLSDQLHTLKARETLTCYYHTRFGARAQKCKPPCQFRSENLSANR